MAITASWGRPYLLHPQPASANASKLWNAKPQLLVSCTKLTLSSHRGSRHVQQDQRSTVRACEEKAEDTTCSDSTNCSRRGLMLLGVATAVGCSSARADPGTAEPGNGVGEQDSAPRSGPGPDTTITDRVFLDIGICPNGTRTDRTLGDSSQICSDPEALGRIVIGLYGKQVPQTVANFKAMVTGTAGSTYEGSIFHRVLSGQYIQAGRQGSRERGEVPRPKNLDRNPEAISASSFQLRHGRPGTVSLSLSENDDDEALKLSPEYRNVEFLITTGPAPAPQFDNRNIVFGTVLEGLDVVAVISSVPTYKPSERIRQFNDIAEFLGDDRALNARNLWNRPLKSVVISKCGVLKVAKPSLPPGLP